VTLASGDALLGNLLPGDAVGDSRTVAQVSGLRVLPGIATLEAFGQPTLTRLGGGGTVQHLFVSGIASKETFGTTARVRRTVKPAGVATPLSLFPSTTLFPSATLLPGGVGQFGTALLSPRGRQAFQSTAYQA
jgi:hypothetical protein